MGTTLNRHAYQRLIDEDLEWLLKKPRTLERDHVEGIVRRSLQLEYAPLDGQPARVHSPTCVKCGHSDGLREPEGHCVICGCNCEFSPTGKVSGAQIVTRWWNAEMSPKIREGEPLTGVSQSLADAVDAALATVRKEEREAAFKDAIQAVRNVQENFVMNGGRSARDREAQRRQSIYIRGLDDARGALEAAANGEKGRE